MDETAQQALARALLSLEGLSIGDAFGQRFFALPATLHLLIGERSIPAAPWRYTDDTQMALSICVPAGRRGLQPARAHGTAGGKRGTRLGVTPTASPRRIAAVACRAGPGNSAHGCVQCG